MSLIRVSPSPFTPQQHLDLDQAVEAAFSTFADALGKNVDLSLHGRSLLLDIMAPSPLAMRNILSIYYEFKDKLDVLMRKAWESEPRSFASIRDLGVMYSEELLYLVDSLGISDLSAARNRAQIASRKRHQTGN